MTQATTFFQASILTFATTLLSLQGCATTAAGRASKAPLTVDEARVFEHGVDFIGALAGLAGRWRDEWNRDLNVRVASADAIVMVAVKTQRTDIDPQRRVTHRLSVLVDSELFGDVSDPEIELLVREDMAGFASVDDNLARLQGQRFVAYLKWHQERGGGVVTHWHLSPASDEIVSETERAAGVRRSDGKSTRRVIVHNH